MNWVYYNPDGTMKGLEARYRVKNNVLQIELCGANHKQDWIDSIFVKSIKRHGYKVNKKYYYMAFRLFRHLHSEYNLLYIDVRINGHSMGGAVGSLLKTIIFNIYYPSLIITWRSNISLSAFGSPRSGIPGICNINKGELAHLYPFWYPKYKYVHVINKKWQVPWKAHIYNWRFKE